MARLKELAISRSSEVLLFDPNIIKEIPGYNVRDMESEATKKHIEQMVKALHSNGIMGFPPITIAQKDGSVFVYSGHCRRRAFSLAKEQGAPIKGIPCIVNKQNEEDRTLDLINSNEGLPLTPMEKAEAIQRLFKFGWTKAEVAEKIGVTIQTIYNLCTLNDADPEIKGMVNDGEVSASTAIYIIKKDKGEAKETLKKVVKKAKKKGKKKATVKKQYCCPKCNHKFN